MRTIEERDLRRALEPCRPDPEAFRRAVERKLAEREDEATGRRAGGMRGGGDELRASAWREAASVLPLELFDPAGLPSASGLVLGKPALAGGGLLGILALPAVSLAVLALTFVRGARSVLSSLAPDAGRASVARAGAGADRERAAASLVRGWWRARAGRALVVFGALAWLAWSWPAEGVVAVLVASMGVVAVLVARLARAGVATRVSVGAFAASFLGALLGGGLLLGELAPGFGRGIGARLTTTAVPGYWTPALLFWGCLSCDLLGRWSPGWPRARKLAAALGPTVLVVGFLALVHGGTRVPDEERLARFVERSAPSLDDAVAWRRLGRVGAWLAERGQPVSTARARAAVLEAWERGRGRQPLLDPSFSVHALAGAARLGLLPDDLWAALADDDATRDLLEGRAVIASATHAELRLRALARRGLDGEQRDLLGRLLAAAWPRPGDTRALQEMAASLELAEVLGHPLEIDRGALRDDVLRALEQHWLGAGPDAPEAAAFASEPAGPGASALPGAPLHLEPTQAALALVERLGVPAGIELGRLRRWLERTARPSLVEALAPAAWPLLTTQPYRYDAAVALRRLEDLPSGVARTDSGRGAGRVLIGAALLVGLCLLATLAAGQRVSRA